MILAAIPNSTDWIIPCVLALAGVMNLILSIVCIFWKDAQKDSLNKLITAALYLDTLFFLLLALVMFLVPAQPESAPAPSVPAATESAPSASTEAPQTEPTQTLPPETEAPQTEPTEAEPTQTEPAETEPEATEPQLSEFERNIANFHPHKVASSDPANWEIEWEILVNDEVVPSYTREDSIFFGAPEQYGTFPGISTFRGNNFRDNATYGTTVINNQTISKKWSVITGSFNGWAGSGWTGQPLAAKWDAQTKSVMNMYPEKQAKEDLVEVIYATLDGYVYFLDMEDGSRTRDPLFVGMNFKGSGSLDPRGYPLLYVGSGDIDLATGKHPRMFIVSLIDGSILWQYGNLDSLSYREWCGYDGAPLIHAETDTLIWPGENGLFYTFRLNTKYDPAAGTVSVAPEMAAAARYRGDRSAPGKYPLGMEDSVLMVGNYLYISDNAGYFFCVDINTMELIWVQDTLDDNNTTAVFEWGEDGNGYLYTSPALKWSCMPYNNGDLYLFKIDAQTGEILWKKPYYCFTEEDVPGGVLSSPAVGKPGTDLEGLVFFSVSSYEAPERGIITALDTQTGEPVWTTRMESYGWSSPVDFYTEDGKGYLIMECLYGEIYLIDGATGEILSTEDLDGHIEASPFVYENTVIIGTRGSRIFGLELS